MAYGLGISGGYDRVLGASDNGALLPYTPISGANGYGADVYIRLTPWLQIVPELHVGYHRVSKNLLTDDDSLSTDADDHKNTFVPLLVGARWYVPVVPIWLEGHAGIAFVGANRKYGVSEYGDYRHDSRKSFAANVGAGVEFYDFGRTQLGLLVRYSQYVSGGKALEHFSSFGIFSAALDIGLSIF